MVTPPRRKLLKTHQQKENGRTSSESAISSYLLVPITSTNPDESESISNEDSTHEVEQPAEGNRMETDVSSEGDIIVILIEKEEKEKEGKFV